MAIQINKGLTPLHLGIIINDSYLAPPSQFALAYLATQSPSELELTLAKAIKNISQDKTPLMLQYTKKGFNVDTLRDLAKQKSGSQKIIDKTALVPVNQDNQLLTLSLNEQASFLIESRRLREEQKPYSVRIYHPFDFNLMRFSGGTPFVDTTLERGNHWSRGMIHEKRYLDSLPKSARNQYEREFQIIDYARACSLTGLAKLVKEKSVQKIGGNYTGNIPTVAIPYDFSKHPELAIETFLLLYSKPSALKEAGVIDAKIKSSTLSLSDVDKRLLGKNILSDIAKQEFAKGNLQKGVAIQYKSYPNYTWAIVQALEEYFFSQGRLFKGYSEEFVGSSKYRSTSIVFDFPTKSRQEDKDISVRIVCDNNFDLPYILYKNFDSSSYINKWQLLDRNPVGMINFSLERQRADPKKWKDLDWRTGRYALCTIREPNAQILNRASEISRNINGIGISTINLKYKYVQAMQSRLY